MFASIISAAINFTASSIKNTFGQQAANRFTAHAEFLGNIVRDGEFRFTILGDVQGVLVVQDDLFFRMISGSDYSGPNGAATKLYPGRPGQPVIVINSELANSKFRDAVLAHELGHIHSGHLKGLSVRQSVFIEMEADNYAVSLGYGQPMLEMLEEARHLAPLDIGMRIDNIKLQLEMRGALQWASRFK